MLLFIPITRFTKLAQMNVFRAHNQIRDLLFRNKLTYLLNRYNPTIEDKRRKMRYAIQDGSHNLFIFHETV